MIPKRKPKNSDQAAEDSQEPASQPAFMLFDLIDDPSEATDLAEKHPEIVHQMTETLNRWRRSCQKSLAGEDYDPGSSGKTP